MLLTWRIRYIDRNDHQFKNRDLYLVTEELDAVSKAAVEASEELRESRGYREMLRHRRLFKSQCDNRSAYDSAQAKSYRTSTFSIPDYFEDENGNEVPQHRLFAVLTGNENALTLPPGAKLHDIDYILAPKQPVCIDQIVLSAPQLQALSYFARDLKELASSAFFSEGPGRLCYGVSAAGQQPVGFSLTTAVSDEEIRSFVTVFRRLYMEKEPANFAKAATILSDSHAGYPLGAWVAAGLAEYLKSLGQPPDHVPSFQNSKVTFSRKRLIDVFLYTQYAHQPDIRRINQFQDYLRQVSGHRDLLTHLFLSEIWTCGLAIWNVGQYIPQFLDAYYRCHQLARDVVESPAVAHPGLGSLEKKLEREQRILREKAEELAQTIWENSGRPPGGHHQFVEAATTALRSAIES
jgi:hypothetical protein